MSKFTFDPRAPVILVNVTLRGPVRQHCVRMILDTGASYTLVAPEILLNIGLDPAHAKDRRTITTASGVEFVPFLIVPSLATLGVARENTGVCAHSLPANIPARGLLGLEFLRHFNLHLNFRDSTLEIF